MKVDLMEALSFTMTARSSEAVLHARIALMKSFKFLTPIMTSPFIAKERFALREPGDSQSNVKKALFGGKSRVRATRACRAVTIK